MKKYVAGVLALFFMIGLVACTREEEKKESTTIEEKKEAVAGVTETKLPEGHPAIGDGAEQPPTIGGKEAVVAGDRGQKKGNEDITKVAAGHPAGKEEKRDIRVPDDVKAKWKAVNLKVVDREKKREDSLVVKVGKETPVKGTNLAVKVEAFLPHYMRYDTYISSKSSEPVNPAVFVELLDGSKSLAKGWVFANFPAFNSYKHARYEILLPTISSGDIKK